MTTFVFSGEAWEPAISPENPISLTALVAYVSLGAILIVALHLHSHQMIQQAREKGLWPPLGEVPTLDQVSRLAQAGEMILAIKLYRQIHPVSLGNAKAAVDRLRNRLALAPDAATPPATKPARDS